MRQRVLRREPRAVISRNRGGAGARAGAARHHPARRPREEIVRHCRADEHRFCQAEVADRAHRLSGAAGGAADRGALRATGSANGAIGAPPRRTSPTPRRCCRSARRSRWSRRICDAIADALAELARRYRDTPMAGRSNLQQAVPITFGYKMRVAARRRSSATASGSRSCGRACWSASSAAPPARSRRSAADGLEVQAELMDELGLGQPEIAWHTVRDRIAEVGCFLGLVAGTCGKIAIDVKLLMQTEVEEVFEPFHEGRGSSSTMPQKRNPISSVYIPALLRVVRQHVAALLDADGRGPRALDRAVGDRMDRAAGNFPARRRRLGADAAPASAGLQVDEKRMRANLDITRGADRVRGGDDGARPAPRPPARARSRLRHLPRGGRERPAARRSAGRERGNLAASRRARSSRDCAIRPIISAWPARWSIACSPESRDERPRHRPSATLDRPHARSGSDTVTPVPVAALAATLDRDDPPPRAGDPLPPLWHWLYFLPLHRQSRDRRRTGTRKRGGFLPPVPLPRRMWAGGRFTFHRPLRIGERDPRTSHHRRRHRSKAGRSGALVFVHRPPRDGGATAARRGRGARHRLSRGMPQPGEAAPAPRPAPDARRPGGAHGARRRAAVPLLGADLQRPPHPLRPPLRHRGRGLSRDWSFTGR